VCSPSLSIQLNGVEATCIIFRCAAVLPLRTPSYLIHGLVISSYQACSHVRPQFCTGLTLPSLQAYSSQQYGSPRFVRRIALLTRHYFIANFTSFLRIKKKSKAITVTGRGGLYGCEMLRIPHCLYNRLTDGGKFVSPAHRPHFTPQKHYFSVSDTHFC
jgi:hypothetical protein